MKKEEFINQIEENIDRNAEISFLFIDENTANLLGVEDILMSVDGGAIVFRKKDEKLHSVYGILPNSNYGGEALVAADSIEEANGFISEFKQRDRYNALDSFGYGEVDDIKEHLFSDQKGIIDYGIYYIG